MHFNKETTAVWHLVTIGTMGLLDTRILLKEYILHVMCFQVVIKKPATGKFYTIELSKFVHSLYE